MQTFGVGCVRSAYFVRKRTRSILDASHRHRRLKRIGIHDDAGSVGRIRGAASGIAAVEHVHDRAELRSRRAVDL